MHASAGGDSGPERLHTFLAEVQSLRSTFAQHLFDENMRLLEEATGVMSLHRPGRFRWTYESPYPQEIVGDGERVWIYDVELEQVTVSSLDETLGDSPAALLSTDRGVEKSFEIRDLGAQGELAWVELRSRSTHASFSAIRLGFDARTLSMMELVDSFGQLTQIRFLDVEVNPALDASQFQFSPPPGTDVIER